jgi:hypothetical protein
MIATKFFNLIIYRYIYIYNTVYTSSFISRFGGVVKSYTEVLERTRVRGRDKVEGG